MEDKRKLTAVIMGAIAAYIQMEPPPQVTPRVKPRTKAEQWKISRQQELMRAKRAKH